MVPPQKVKKLPKKLVTFFRQHTNIDDELKRMEKDQPKIKRSNLDHWLRVWFKHLQPLLNPIIFLRFESAEYEMDLRLQLDSELNQRLNVDRFKRARLEGPKFRVPSCQIKMYERNTIYDWTFFEFRRQESTLGDLKNAQNFADSRLDMIKRKFSRCAKDVEELEEENLGKVFSKDQITYDFMLYTSNFTDLVKLQLEKDGEDEYDEELHLEFFNEWLQEEEHNPLNWALNLRFLYGWKMLTSQSIKEHKAYHEFLGKSNLREIVEAYYPGKSKEELEEKVRNAYICWCEVGFPYGMLKDLKIYEERDPRSKDKPITSQAETENSPNSSTVDYVDKSSDCEITEVQSSSLSHDGWVAAEEIVATSIQKSRNLNESNKPEEIQLEDSENASEPSNSLNEEENEGLEGYEKMDGETCLEVFESPDPAVVRTVALESSSLLEHLQYSNVSSTDSEVTIIPSDRYNLQPESNETESFEPLQSPVILLLRNSKVVKRRFSGPLTRSKKRLMK